MPQDSKTWTALLHNSTVDVSLIQQAEFPILQHFRLVLAPYQPEKHTEWTMANKTPESISPNKTYITAGRTICMRLMIGIEKVQYPPYPKCPDCPFISAAIKMTNCTMQNKAITITTGRNKWAIFQPPEIKRQYARAEIAIAILLKINSNRGGARLSTLEGRDTFHK